MQVLRKSRYLLCRTVQSTLLAFLSAEFARPKIRLTRALGGSVSTCPHVGIAIS